MKLTLLLLIATFLTSLFSTAQDTLPHLNYNLVALRNGKHTIYKVGKRLVLKYNDGSSTKRVRGAFAGMMNGNIAIGAKRGNESMRVIPIEDVSMVRKVHPQRRVIFGIIGTVLLGGGIAAIGDGGNSPGSAMKVALVIPVIGIGCYFLFAVPVTLIAEKLNEKKRKNGWKFELSGQ